jgi:hypothetical protein
MWYRIGTATDEVFVVPEVIGTTFPRRNLMSDALSIAEIDGQHVELLPARTVLSVFSAGGGGGRGGNGGEGGTGGVGRGGLGLNLINLNLFGDQTNSAGDGFGGAGGSAGGGTGGASNS